jgi:hypothetical protein
MTVLLSPIGNSMTPFLGLDNLPLAGGLLYTYQAGTTTALATYTGVDGLIPCANPIVLGVNGISPTPIWLSSTNTYKFVLATSANVVLYTYDNISGIPGAGSVINVPTGGIIMWSGAATDIPSGYVLCNGNNGTPNLLDSFVVCAGNSYAVNSKGGFVSSGVVTSAGTNAPFYYALAYIMKT